MLIDDLVILKKNKSWIFKFQLKFFNMQELNYDENSKVLNHTDEVISFKCELQENLQNLVFFKITKSSTSII